ncbi:MAG TPA: DUF4258 domain-containing protein [Methylomirabilota bacterium]|nr:DUF4258 domain-containing protein [Methylomirabilota bacterium]
MAVNRLVFRIHALKRMFQRSVSAADVRRVLETGETIETYPDGTPFPSRLVLGWVGARSLHVVAADDPQAEETIVITVYEPDRSEWEPDFKQRKPS